MDGDDRRVLVDSCSEVGSTVNRTEGESNDSSGLGDVNTRVTYHQIKVVAALVGVLGGAYG